MEDFSSLLVRFTRAVAANDGTGFAALFTADGVYDDGFFGEYKGRQAIASASIRDGSGEACTR